LPKKVAKKGHHARRGGENQHVHWHQLPLFVIHLPDPQIHALHTFAHGHMLVHTARGRSPREVRAAMELQKLFLTGMEIYCHFTL
jgi:hypothetical protein